MANEKRLIDVEQAKRATYEEIFWTESEQAVVRNFLAKIPKVDAVEVVRCKDCKHWQEHDGDMYCGCWANLMTDTAADDFCSYGERKDGE
jgi:hypothetical protein